jgi:hypothetical protein
MEVNYLSDLHYLIVAAADIDLSLAQVRLLIEGEGGWLLLNIGPTLH